MSEENRGQARSAQKPGLPLPGQRIIRSVVAAFWCCVVYFLRGRNGAPFYSIIAAMQCIQPYTANMLKVGKNRIRGTLIGASWGAVVLLGAFVLSGGNADYEESFLYYMVLVVMIGVVLYFTVLLEVRESSWFSCVVFLSITINHIGDVNPFLFVLNRTLDTMIGVGIAVIVNSAHLPRVRDRETLFVSGVDHVLFREDRNLSVFTKIQLNRFIQDGMRFSVSTKQTPATVRELTQGIGLRLPIIAMDGAVLYDMGTRTYLRTEKMDRDTAGQVTAFLLKEGVPFQVNTVADNLLVSYCRGFRPDGSQADSGSEAIRALYLKKRNSPYRNYVGTEEDVVDNVLYFLVIDKKENTEKLCDLLMRQPWSGSVRPAFDTFDCREGEMIMRIYSGRATRRAMLDVLREYVGAPRTVLFGTQDGECDVVIPDAGGGNMVKELKKRYEPVSIRGWRNMIHF